MENIERFSTSDPHPAEVGLPTLSKLGNPQVPTDIDPQKVAAAWLRTFDEYATQGDANGVLSLMVNSDFISASILSDKASPPTETGIPVFWRDLLALTWDLKTFDGTPAIQKFLQARLTDAKISNVKLGTVSLDNPFPDLLWIQLFFTFETEVGLASGIARLVPLPISSSQPAAVHTDLNTGDITWKAHLIFTNLEDLKDFPENIGIRRSSRTKHGRWEALRQTEVAFEARDPTVLIIGGGQSGLDVAARLKALGIDALIVEKHKRIGDNWRTRYEGLCLQDTVWTDHLPYLPFPSTWPTFCPAKKLANWLESYAEALELNVWTSATVTNAIQDPQSKTWAVTVKSRNGSERVLNVKHVVMAFGLRGGKGYIPQYPGMDKFKGEMLHSNDHNQAEDHLGKKVVVIGSSAAAHDICVEYVDSGIDVTMFQRSSTYVMSVAKGIPHCFSLYSENGPPTHIADLLTASTPYATMVGLSYRATKTVAQLDRETLEGLTKVGFKLNYGLKDAGFFLGSRTKASGYYLDVGGSQYIIDKKIKLKNDSQIREFTETGIKFENGSELEADIVVFCTGVAGSHNVVRTIFGDEVAEKTGELFGLDGDGEMKGLYKQLGYKGMYAMMGNLSVCRFYSKHLALQIKAIEEQLFDGKGFTTSQ